MSLLGEGIDEVVARETAQKPQGLTRGNRAVINRLHARENARENARDVANLGWVAAGIGAAVLIVAAARKRV